MSSESTRTSPIEIQEYYKKLYSDSSLILEASFSNNWKNNQAESHNFILNYSQWLDLLINRPEHILLRRAASEYQFALLALVLGQYRQAFAALRLFQELTLGAVYFSANELDLREWLRGDQDIKWSAIKDHENGVFSKRFVRAFFDRLEEDTIIRFRSIAEKVYRECSEYVHGNISTHNTIPNKLEFIEEAFIEWHEKARNIHSVVNFAFCVRYLRTFNKSDQMKIEHVVIDTVGFVPEIRYVFEESPEES